MDDLAVSNTTQKKKKKFKGKAFNKAKIEGVQNQVLILTQKIYTDIPPSSEAARNWERKNMKHCVLCLMLPYIDS